MLALTPCFRDVPVLGGPCNADLAICEEANGMPILVTPVDSYLWGLQSTQGHLLSPRSYHMCETVRNYYKASMTFSFLYVGNCGSSRSESDAGYSVSSVRYLTALLTNSSVLEDVWFF